MAYSFLDMAYDVLKDADRPLTHQEIWAKGAEAGLAKKLRTSGRTPWASLGSRLYVDIRDNRNTKFIKIGKRPARFFLAERKEELPRDVALKLDREEAEKPERATGYREEDLHPLLAYYVYSNPAFNRGRAIYTKTIRHRKSRKSRYAEWTHPDMVGFSLPLEDWESCVFELNRLSDNNSLRLFSFELKKVLNKSNYREAYFQAVSNSSWAHQGYLVAADIAEDDELLSELQRLSASFGIGIIRLEVGNVDESSVVFPARESPALDWETMNKLCELNQDFATFLENVKIDLESKRVHRAEYDRIVDPVEYVRERIKL